ncbi:MAG TPA: Na-translocating system protein MpsB, partial [Terrimicrobiaceae bacterium]|nr:Na-translocating system protein MpsB [Terrimicrobiaceae bacterium]
PGAARPRAVRPAVQAVFCIDVRSEILRRGLEAASERIETLSFAGFFGMAIESIPFGQHSGTAQCPVLLTPKFRVRETLRHADARTVDAAWQRQRRGKRLAYSCNAFKTSAISCFSFVETAGLAFGPKLFRDAFIPSAARPVPVRSCGPQLETSAADGTGISPGDRVQLALGALRHMGLTKNFARLVLLCGHGSETANNPYGAGLDCGACGGHAGDANARVAAAILNDPAVREALGCQGILIPEDTWFLAGLHNTTTDEVSLFDTDDAPAEVQKEIAELRGWLVTAAASARRERATLLGIDGNSPDLDRKIRFRSRDWAEVRPEWGLAGNAAFIAAPRARTAGVRLGGRVFLHNYDHHADPGDSTLELILTAPMVVANWINLQYFGSTVNNGVFGSGSKVTHNVVGTLGVCQGNGGDLQTGLPLQSVHDGEKWVHDPVRLHVLIEAPRERIAGVLARHENVLQLVNHGWLLLFAIEEDGQSCFQCLPGLRWEKRGFA